MIYNIFHYNVIQVFKLYLSTYTYLAEGEGGGERERERANLHQRTLIYHKKCSLRMWKIRNEIQLWQIKIIFGTWYAILIAYRNHKSRSTTMEYRIPPSHEYPLWQVLQDIPTCPKFRITSLSSPPFSFEFPWGTLPKLLSQSSLKHNSLLFQSTITSTKRLWSAIVMCVRSHTQFAAPVSPLFLPLTINKSGFSGFRKWLPLSIQK